MKIWAVVVVTCLLAMLKPEIGHSAESTLSGTVLHANGSTVANAPVRATSEVTGVDARTRSSASGHYEFPDLAAGIYVISVTMPCCEFIPFVDENVSITAGKDRAFDIQMAPGNVFVEGDDPATINAEVRNRQVIPDEPIPRTAQGKPDLTGVWLTSEDPYPEPVQALPWAEELAQRRTENWFIDDPMVQCLPGSPPIPGASSFMTRFVQRPELLVILLEDTVGFRQVFLDGRKHPTEPYPTWTGHSIGHWDSDTLVIDTVGYNSRGWTGIYPRTEALHMVERYTRSDYGHLQLQLTFEDPGVFSAPWTQNMTWDLAPQEEVMEYVCENNKWAQGQNE